MSAFIGFQLEKEGPKKNWVFRKRIKLSVFQLLFNCLFKNLRTSRKIFKKKCNADF